MINTLNTPPTARHDEFAKKEISSYKQSIELSNILNSIEELRDILSETEISPDISDVDNLKKFLIERHDLLQNFELTEEKINEANSLEIYTIIAREICSADNTEKYHDLDYCFDLAKDAVDTLGGDHYALLQEHYQC